MTVEQIYRTAIQVGMELDFRGKEFRRQQVAASRAEYKALSPQQRASFDTARLDNPFGDTRIINGPLDRQVNSVLVGIEIHEPELLLAHALRQSGKPVDLVISHHTTCINRGAFYPYDIVDNHKSALAEIGADMDKGDQLVEQWKQEVEMYWQDVAATGGAGVSPAVVRWTGKDACPTGGGHRRTAPTVVSAVVCCCLALSAVIQSTPLPPPCLP